MCTHSTIYNFYVRSIDLEQEKILPIASHVRSTYVFTASINNRTHDSSIWHQYVLCLSVLILGLGGNKRLLWVIKFPILLTTMVFGH